MSNKENEVLNHENDLFLLESDIEIANAVELFDGTEINPDVLLDALLNENKQKKNTRTKKNTQASKKRKRTSPNEANTMPPSEPPAKRTRAKNNTIKKTKQRQKRTATTSFVDLGEPCDSTTHVEKSQNHERDDHSESSESFEMMTRITRSGAAISRIRKRFQEIMNGAEIEIDPECFKCILCFERKKTVVLYPCEHQHTCEPCWFSWKIEQINKMPDHQLEDESFDEIIPTCPVCRKPVEKARN